MVIAVRATNDRKTVPADEKPVKKRVILTCVAPCVRRACVQRADSEDSASADALFLNRIFGKKVRDAPIFLERKGIIEYERKQVLVQSQYT